MLAQKVTLGALCHNFSISCWGVQFHHWTASSLGTNHSPRFATQPVCLSLAMDPKWNARGKLIFKHLQNMTHPTLGVFLGPPGEMSWMSQATLIFKLQFTPTSVHFWWRYWVPQATLKGGLQRKKERKKGRKEERKEERKKERTKRKNHKRETNKWTKKRKTASELDATWYDNCRKESTTGWISFISFAHSVNVQNAICLAHARFTEHWWLVQGCLSLFKGTPNCVPTVRAHLWQKSYKILQD